ncbi:hypothetical protein N7448_010301 [Penicillium atrosanguineum]|uniref:uncharacterized protein n=1 Tax=Penicillium atrosanguineum TaxID=1132637 RepID=UPI00239EF7D0|nr:uncharacterized protein N7443_007526 [Penicillium atrosanguineum]KAJ5118594.1 hypothetical protein N7526_010231 [Penicillium atrosanguineum]KAJ5119632.1 hypothetical protein N7448_010301 [Penicillium atrosanguineum]KAJ5296633.1 hypothetical protein N7443_007526 [Penicillium atrosanguineum]
MSSSIQTYISDLTSLFIDNNERLKRLPDRIEDFSRKVNEFYILVLQTPSCISPAATTSNTSTASPDEHPHTRSTNSIEEIRKITVEIQALTRDIQAATGNIRTLGSKNQELIIRIDAYAGTIESLSQSLDPFIRGFVAFARSVLAVLNAITPGISILSCNVQTLAGTVTVGGLHIFAGSLEEPLCRDIQTLAGSLQDLAGSSIVYLRSVSV